MKNIFNPKKLACLNFEKLAANPYPGRGIVVGLDETGKYIIQVFFITGRSEHSRNRVLKYNEKTGRVFTVAADPAKAEDPAIVQGRKSGIYNAMLEYGNLWQVVSNGSQTDDCIGGDESFDLAMRRYSYESDPPNYTPRITAVSMWLPNFPSVLMSILRKSPWNNNCDRILYNFNGLGEGLGYCITTYSGDGDPLPAFQGEPYLLPLFGNINAIAGIFWRNLNPDNRVSLAVKFIPRSGPSEIVILNRFELEKD